MKLIDPHAHMVSRTTDDYEAMAAAGVVAVIEPAFWQGQPRTHVGTFEDYFSSLVGFERFRASQFGIKHYCCMGLNPKEANNVPLAEQVIELLPRFLMKEGVVAVGEIGFDDQTEAEERFLHEQLELAVEFELPVMIHTPHRDKKRGTSRTMDVIAEHDLDPSRVVIDHNNELTVGEVLDRGFWAGFSIYPHTKMSSDRMAVLAEKYGAEKFIVDSACDWGVSDPTAVKKTAELMASRGIATADIAAMCYGNALAIYGLSGQISEADWDASAGVDQRELFEGNSVLRGGQTPRVDASADGAS
ncbi:MAG: TatD family hydrolase [Planctomycetota bacterium]